jgi:trans-AT polyketide synthase/acyltransferase/oxidoreductase domain-containing protein
LGSPTGTPPGGDLASLTSALGVLGQSFMVLEKDGQFTFRPGTIADFSAGPSVRGEHRYICFLPSLQLGNLGDPCFCRDHGLHYAYIAGAMANGIASVELVETMARGGMLGFFGAAGLSPAQVAVAIDRLQREIPGLPFGVNLIHSPNEPAIEAAVADLLLQSGVRLIEASAYLRLTLPVVRYRVKGIHRDVDGNIVTPNRIVAKVSRVEVATQFFSSPPVDLLNELVRTGEITAEQAQLAGHIPVAQDVTAEADSAGHTDNRPLVTLLPTLLALRDRLQAKFDYAQPLRVGAAGGLSTPASLAAAFTMGAAYVVTGSVNQACVESGSSDAARKLLAQAEQADTAMAPAADMFEMGVKLQVLKRGTMFAMRATKLWELYRTHASLDAIPTADRDVLEKQHFRTSLVDTWVSTRAFWQKRDPAQVERAERDPKHKMALVFRSYLGLSSRWANAGESARVLDYQIWCGPAMGAFNEWTRGTFLAQPENRRAALVGLNLLYGAAVQLRLHGLRLQGVCVPAGGSLCPPLTEDELHERLKNDE